MQKYKDLNRAELHKLFGKDISEYIFEERNDQSNDEIVAARYIEQKFKIRLKHVPKVKYPKKVKTPDYASADNKILLVEVKTALSLKHGIENAFVRAKAQLNPFSNAKRRILALNIDEIIKDNSVYEIIRKTKDKAKETNYNYDFCVLNRGKPVFERYKNRAGC